MCMCRLGLLIVLLAMQLGYAQKAAQSVVQEGHPPIEVRLTEPLAWKGYCLQVSIDRVNRSRSPIFLPFQGIVISSSVTDATNTLKQGSGVAWLNVYGVSDNLTTDLVRLGPGEVRHDVYCIRDTFPVVNRQEKLRRQVRVQGSLRIFAGYFPEAQNWQISAAERESMKHSPAANWKNADRSKGGWAMLELSIPCSTEVSKPDCALPPPVFAGEGSPTIPDIGS